MQNAPNVILIGAGRYGNGLIGKKYADNKIDAKLSAVVDPKIGEISKKDGFVLSNVPQYDTFERVSKELKTESSVAELAVVPDIIPMLFNKIKISGIKKIIFPKPVASSQKEFNKMRKEANEGDIQTAIASNWHYSEITKQTRDVVDKIKTGSTNCNSPIANELEFIPNGLEIKKVELEYNKKHETLQIPPPSQEMPHALQIIYSTGLSDFNGVKRVMAPEKQSKSAVNIEYQNVKGIEGGIVLNSDLRKGDACAQNRERVLKIYLNDDDNEADIITDYDAVFKDGKPIKLGNIKVDIQKDGTSTFFQKEIKEDNLEVMYKDIFEYFKTGDDKAVLTLDKYAPVMAEISYAQRTWDKIVN